MAAWLLVLLLALPIFYVLYFYHVVSKYPPGPRPFPFLGNLLSLARSEYPHKKLEEFSREWGPVFTVWLPSPVVVVTSLREMRECLVEKAANFSGRPSTPTDSLFLNAPNGGIIFSEGPSWQEQRAFAHRLFRQFGVGSERMEQKIFLALHSFEQFVDEQQQELDVQWPLQLCVANVIEELLFGRRTSFSDCARLRHFQSRIEQAMVWVRSRASVLLVQTYPWLRHAPLVGHWGYTQLREVALELLAHVREEIISHQKELHPGQQPHTFVAAYLQEIASREELGEPHSFSMENLENFVMDFWLAGMETAATVLRWGLLFLVQKPELQEEVHDELMRVCGEGLVSMQYQTHVPLARALSLECLRLANVVTFNVFHKTQHDDSIAGLSVPAGSTVLPQVTSVLSSPEEFEKPDEFNPYRFLDEQGRWRKDVADRVVAFSLGKRQCAGEPLGRMEVFLILTNLVKRYRLLSSQPPNPEPVFGILQTPKPFTVRLERRK